MASLRRECTGIERLRRANEGWRLSEVSDRGFGQAFQQQRVHHRFDRQPGRGRHLLAPATSARMRVRPLLEQRPRYEARVAGDSI
eukprot:2098694-Pleurochrysis_carterae.AAC.1